MQTELIEAVIKSDTNADLKINNLEELILQSDHVIDFPLTHLFIENMYLREIFMPAGSLLTSKIHKTQHPFTILSGVAHVFTGKDDEVITYGAGHIGITQPNTRRVLYIEEDCKWVTYHPLTEQEEQLRLSGATTEEMLEVVEDRIIETHTLPSLNGESVFSKYQEKLAEQKMASLEQGDK